MEEIDEDSKATELLSKNRLPVSLRGLRGKRRHQTEFPKSTEGRQHYNQTCRF